MRPRVHDPFREKVGDSREKMRILEKSCAISRKTDVTVLLCYCRTHNRGKLLYRLLLPFFPFILNSTTNVKNDITNNRNNGQPRFSERKPPFRR